MTSIGELEDRQTALIERLNNAGAIIVEEVSPTEPSEGPTSVVWELRGHHIEVPALDPLQLGRVATMLIEADARLAELLPQVR